MIRERSLTMTLGTERAGMARQINQPSKGIWGTQIRAHTGEDGASEWTNYLIQNGGEHINAGRTKDSVNSAAGVEVLQFWTDLIQKKHVCRGPDDPLPPEGVRKVGMDTTQAASEYTGYPAKMPDYEYALRVAAKNKTRGVVVRGQDLSMRKNGIRQGQCNTWDEAR